MLLSRHQEAAQNQNRAFENVTQFRYLGTTVINQNLIQEDVKKRLKSGNACYHSVQNLLPSRLLYKNVNRREKKILIPVSYACETWSLMLRKERRLRVFENRVLRRIFGPKRDEMTREWRKLQNQELRDLYSSPSIIRMVKWRRMRWQAWAIGRMHARYRRKVTTKKTETEVGG
jgi:hypothetical protein